MPRIAGHATLVLALAAAAVSGVAAGTVQIEPAKDNTLYEDAAGGLSNGAGARMFAGTTATGEVRRAVLAFDVAGGLPPGAEITSVSLTLQMSKTLLAQNTAVSLHRVLADWGEGGADAPGEEGGGAAAVGGDATWIHTFSPGQFWMAAGGDYDVVASASTAVVNVGPYTWTSDLLLDDVKDWQADPAGNFGWLVLGDESEIATAKRFDSRESSNPPVLTIDFDEPGAVPATSPLALAALVLLLAAGAVAVHRRRAVRGA